MAEGTSPQGKQPWLRDYAPGVHWDAGYTAQPLHSILDDAAAKMGARPCLDFLDKHYTYAEVLDLANRVAKGLQEAGVKPGDRVGLLLPNTPYYVAAYFGILKAGAIVVNLNPLYAEKELRHLVEDSGVEILFTLDVAALYDKVALLLTSTRLRRVVVCKMSEILPFPKNLLFPLLRFSQLATIPADVQHLRFSRLTANDGRFQPQPVDPVKDLAVLQYTGGTTGLSKGAMLTHANVYINALQLSDWFPEREIGKETLLCVLPLFHVFAMTAIMHWALMNGGSMILLPRFDLDQLLKVITKKKPSIFHAVPTLYAAIASHPKIADFDLTSIKSCISGGAPLPMEVKSRFEALTGCRLVEGYGLSEAAPVLSCNPLNGENKAGSVGQPLPCTTIEIVALDDPDRVLPLGERGEITGTGPQVMAGYWQKPEVSAKTLRKGRLHTGDVGYLDEDGYLFIVDRIKEMIIASGYKVYPRMVEEALYEHPAVAECAVIGAPDAYRGETVMAVVALAPGQRASEEELTAFLKARLAPMEMPKIYKFRDSLPKTPVGKIEKKVLVAEYVGEPESVPESEQG
ncbi:MAG: long-chain fatty acid--CoA ligase [Kiloniellales bacterium]|nr:long-chain fatty acid--CoA ligase [Kiloniellales bacterium]